MNIWNPQQSPELFASRPRGNEVNYRHYIYRWSRVQIVLLQLDDIT